MVVNLMTQVSNGDCRGLEVLADHSTSAGSSCDPSSDVSSSMSLCDERLVRIADQMRKLKIAMTMKSEPVVKNMEPMKTPLDAEPSKLGRSSKVSPVNSDRVAFAKEILMKARESTQVKPPPGKIPEPTKLANPHCLPSYAA